MPIKPNASGLFELYTKQEMRQKLKVRSPNLADCIMMSERNRVIIKQSEPTTNDIMAHYSPRYG